MEETMKDLRNARLETSKQALAALELDLLLLELESQVELLDGIPLKDWIISEVSE